MAGQQNSRVLVSSTTKNWMRTTNNSDLVVLLTPRYFGEKKIEKNRPYKFFELWLQALPFPTNISFWELKNNLILNGIKMRATKNMSRTTRFPISVVLRLPTFDSNFATLNGYILRTTIIRQFANIHLRHNKHCNSPPPVPYPPPPPPPPRDVRGNGVFLLHGLWWFLCCCFCGELGPGGGRKPPTLTHGAGGLHGGGPGWIGENGLESVSDLTKSSVWLLSSDT